MKSPSLILLFSLIFSLASGQEKTDSVRSKIDSLFSKVPHIPDSLPTLPDSLLAPYHKIDSIRNAFNHEADSLKNEYNSAIGKLDKTSGKLSHTIDSLEHLNLPTGKYTHKLDSINQLRQKKVSDFNSKVAALKTKTTGKLNALDLPPQYKEPIQRITGKVDGFNLDGDFVKIPQVSIPGYSLPKLNGVGDIASKVGDVGNVGVGALPKIQTPVGDLGKVGEQVKGYENDIKNITKGDLNQVKELPKTIEQQASKIDGVQELQKEAGVVDGYKDKLEVLKDPNAGKEKAVEMGKKAAIDHFAGKEKQLKAAMDQMSKYKQKYSSVSSLQDLPKRPPNAMKGKPFIERLVPGFYFQYQQKKFNLFDLNPYIGYRLSGRFTTGAGWNQRYAYEKRSHRFNYNARIFGPRVYTDFKLGKGFIAHLEMEFMNTIIPPAIGIIPDEGKREWVFSSMTGIKKEYKIYKNLRGTVLLQYNLFNPHYKAPYVDRLNSRIGFEYALKKRKTRSKV